jgi:hypothetical protein
MSADKYIDIKAKTENGMVYSQFMHWGAKVREQPAVRTTREEVLTILENDPKMAGFVSAIKRDVPKGSVMWIVEAGTGVEGTDHVVHMQARYA